MSSEPFQVPCPLWPRRLKVAEPVKGAGGRNVAVTGNSGTNGERRA